MSRRRVLTTLEEQALVEGLLRRGLSNADIVRETKLSYWGVSRYRKKLNISNSVSDFDHPVKYSASKERSFLADLAKYQKRIPDSLCLKESPVVKIARQLNLSPQSCALTWEN